MQDGRCDDIEQYRRACGIIYGLKMAKDDIGEAFASSEEKEGFDQ